MQIIYLDNNATTPIDNKVLEAMLPFLTSNFANANSTHRFGLAAHEAVKMARNQLAKLIHAESNEIIFTSGATEAANLAIKGIAENYSSKGKHIITISTEHHAVLETCQYLSKKGFEISYLPVSPDGLIDTALFRRSLRSDTILVCAMLANNETGTILPIQAMSDFAHEVGALFMTDATQAVGKIPVDVSKLGVDFLCLSGHKLYAPKGIGALYMRQRGTKLKIPALIHGGGHERGLRSGTLNVPAIVALGAACELAESDIPKHTETISRLRDQLENDLLSIEETSLNGNASHRLPNTTNICFRGADSDALILNLSNPDNQETPFIAVSNGSACTSIRVEPSHVLKAMGLDDTDAFSSIRFSLNKFNTSAEIDTTIQVVKSVVYNLRMLTT